MPKDVVKLLWQIYNRDASTYIINQIPQQAVENQKGVKQGASTSPILFNLLIKKSLKYLNQEN